MATFDPRPHLIKLQGKDYLQVSARLAWLRAEQPDAIVTTEIVAYDAAAEWVIMRATVTLVSGASAQGTVLQRPTGIAKDYFANGETSAIGRALGALGFGTLFALEFDQGEQVIDSPVERKPPNPPDRSRPPTTTAPLTTPTTGISPAITSAGDERRRLNAALLAAMAAHNTQQRQVTTAIKDLFGAVRTGDLTDQQVIDVTGWIEDRMELRYTASGVAVLIPIVPTDVGTLAIETVPFDAARDS